MDTARKKKWCDQIDTPIEDLNAGLAQLTKYSTNIQIYLTQHIVAIDFGLIRRSFVNLYHSGDEFYAKIQLPEEQ